MRHKLVLASSSPYRKQLLRRLNLDFESVSPNLDERLLPAENPRDYVSRLAEAKAQAVAASHPDAVVIGSDQCALRDDEILGKPETHDRALAQLRAAQGKTVVFHTGLCVLHAGTGFREVVVVPFEVEFRVLEEQQLEHYLRVEQPYQCAGSFKAEGYGVCLFRTLRGDDPSALIGLPLLSLVPMLERAGIEVV